MVPFLETLVENLLGGFRAAVDLGKGTVVVRGIVHYIATERIERVSRGSRH